MRNVACSVRLAADGSKQKFKLMDEFVLELDAFADCILRRREPEPSGKEGMRDVAVMQAIYRFHELKTAPCLSGREQRIGSGE